MYVHYFHIEVISSLTQGSKNTSIEVPVTSSSECK